MTKDDAWSDLPVESELARQQGDADGDGLRAGVSGVAGRGVEELLAAVAEFAAQAIPGVDWVAAVAGVRCPPNGAPPRTSSPTNDRTAWPWLVTKPRIERPSVVGAWSVNPRHAVVSGGAGWR
jgi:hypothetical protein